MKRVCLAVFMSMGAVLVAVVAGQAATAIPTPSGVQLTINNVQGEDHTDPHVSGDVAAYTTSQFTSNIHYHNVVTGVDSTIPNGGGFDFLSDIDNGRIAFSRSIPGTNGEIVLFDTSTLAQQVLSPLSGSARDGVSIGGDTVAWQDRTGLPFPANAQLMVYDLVAGTTIALTNAGDAMTNLQPDVSPDGKVVAWVKCQLQSNNNPISCKAWDATRDALGVWTSRQLTFGSLSASHPETNGLIVVYALGQAGIDGAIHYQPVGGGPEQTITMPASTGVTTEVNPAISGELVAFAGYTAAGSSAIWVADLLLGTVYQVSPVQPQASILTDISLATDGTVNVVWETILGSALNQYFVVNGFRYHLDRTAPLLTLPSNISVSATSSTGAVVNYTVTASDPDNTASQLTVSCAPASGATFPIGTTTVTCTASDPQLNTATGSFTVTVTIALDQPLTITGIGAAALGLNAAAGVTFTDADPNGSLSQYSATIDWGDHSAPSSASVVKNPFSPGFAAGGLHRYSAPGTYIVTVTVNDVQGATISRSTTLTVRKRSGGD